jgi:hypothetical protein
MFGVGAGLNVVGGLMGKGAADNAQAGQLAMFEQAQQASKMMAQQAAAMFQPYQLYGTNALSFIQSRILNSAERKMAAVKDRESIASEVQRLSQATDWNSMPILSGAKASERRAELWQKMESDRKQQLQAAQSRLTSYDREQQALAPFRDEQEAMIAKQQGRVTGSLDLVSQQAQELARRSNSFNLPQSLGQLRQDLTNDPIFQFRQEQGERAINRAQAARGGFLSGAALGQIGDFNNQLTADETERYFNRILAGQQASMQSGQIALQGAMTGLNAEMGVGQQDVTNMMGLSQMGLNAAQGAAQATMQGNVVNSQLSSQAATAYGQTELAKGQAMQQMMGGMGQMAGQLAGFSLMNSMMAKPAAPAGPQSGVDTGALSQYVRGGNEYLVNMPGR